MKKLIILLTALIISGCASNPFEIQHLERIVCVGFQTPWANTANRLDDRVTWNFNRNWGRIPAVALSPEVPCIKEIMTKEQLAKINAE